MRDSSNWSFLQDSFISAYRNECSCGLFSNCIHSDRWPAIEALPRRQGELENHAEPRSFQPDPHLETLSLMSHIETAAYDTSANGYQAMLWLNDCNISQCSFMDEPSVLIESELILQLRLVLPAPPLLACQLEPEVPDQRKHRRCRTGSKYGEFHDAIIMNLKREGCSWTEIARRAGVDSPIAARNRYQVIIGQQGNNKSLNWTSKNTDILQSLLDSAEVDKWTFVARELTRLTGKNYRPQECQEFIRSLLVTDPAALGWTPESVRDFTNRRSATDKSSRTDQSNQH